MCFEWVIHHAFTSQIIENNFGDSLTLFPSSWCQFGNPFESEDAEGNRAKCMFPLLCMKTYKTLTINSIQGHKVESKALNKFLKLVAAGI